MGMPTLDLMPGIAVGVAAILGLLIGIRLGKGSGREEAKAHFDRVVSLEAEIARLNGVAAEATERNLRLREQVARAEEREKAQEEKYGQMKADLDKAFGDLAAKALSANNQSFLALAQEKLGAQSADAKRTLAEKEEAIKTLLDPLGKALTSLDTQTREMEKSRTGAYAKVETLVESMQKSIPASLDALKNETAQLITALRAPKTRGNWGELQLRRCVEYAGMLAYCSFSEQVSTRDEDDRLLRPDMTIKLPNEREIVVDAKTPLDAFLEAGNADPALQKLRFEAHAQRVRVHMKELDGKAYWKQFEKAPDFVVCFLPSEALFSAALEADPSLIEFSAQHHVVLATPTTLIALLRAVEFGWQQQEITKNAKAIHEAGKKIYEKLVTAQTHVTRLGNALSNSVDYYNRFLGTIEGKGGVFFHGRQLGELAHSDGELEEIKTLPPGVRAMESEEWSQPLLAVAASDAEADVTLSSIGDQG
jgi:DNA recombination protein RmuC